MARFGVVVLTFFFVYSIACASRRGSGHPGGEPTRGAEFPSVLTSIWRWRRASGGGQGIASALRFREAADSAFRCGRSGLCEPRVQRWWSPPGARRVMTDPRKMSSGPFILRDTMQSISAQLPANSPGRRGHRFRRRLHCRPRPRLRYRPRLHRHSQHHITKPGQYSIQVPRRTVDT